MKLPAIFKQDIQSKNVQLIPLLIIERDDWWDDFVDNPESIFISTHDISIKDADNSIYTDTDVPLYFSPLLLDFPVITEKIDVENRKYTISKCTFKISNNTYNGERFSDMLNTDSLIGKRVNLAYKSINSTVPVGSAFFNIASTPEAANHTWSDLYDDYEYISPTFFFGEIRDIKHDNEVLTITAEDLSSTMMHQELPKNSLPTNSSVIDHYRGVKIPMVYGYVPKSPVVMGANNKIYADSRPIKGWFKNDVANPQRYSYPFGDEDPSALFINTSDNYCCVADTVKYKLGNNDTDAKQATYFNFAGYGDEPTQVTYEEDDSYDTTTIARLKDTPLSARKALQLLVRYKPGKVSLLERDPDIGWNTDTYADLISLGDSDYEWFEDDHLLDSEFETMTDNNFSSGITSSESDTEEDHRVEAMVANITNRDDQLVANKYKHSLFRFVIQTEPPISFINRGGVARHGNYGTYYHWIAFGHWVMPEQSINIDNASHHIFTYAKRDGTNDDESYKTIRWRNHYNIVSTGEEWSIDYDSVEDNTFLYPTLDEALTDSWGNSTYLGDIVRFSDFHDDSDFGVINPEQIQWSSYEENGKSPLQFFNARTIDESVDGTWGSQYSNPFAKFTNQANLGKYIVDLGVYGWRSSETQNTNTTNGFQGYGGDESYLAYNFDYGATRKGWLPEVSCYSVCDTEVNYQDMYGSIKGRVEGENLIQHPADIIADIFVNELGHNPNKIDQQSLSDTKEILNAHGQFKFSFTQKDAINSKELIEDIAKSTFIFPRIGFDGMLRFPQIKKQYEQADLDKSILIEELDIISYNYSLTKKEQLKTGIKNKFDYDYHSKNYFGDNSTKRAWHHQVDSFYADGYNISEEELEFNGFDNVDDNIGEFESKYFRSDIDYDPGLTEPDETRGISKFNSIYLHHYKNRHLIIKCKLPLKYLNIDIGDYIRFDKIIDGVKAYGIDYTKIQEVNHQHRYPLFLCTSIKKSIEYVEIECMQLHHLEYMNHPISPLAIWNDIGVDEITSVYKHVELIDEEQEQEDEDVIIYGCTNPDAENYNPDATSDDGSCILPQVNVTQVEIEKLTSKEYYYTTFGDWVLQPPYVLYGADELPSVVLWHQYPTGGTWIGVDPSLPSDPNCGLNTELVSTSTIRKKESGNFIEITSWNDLAPGWINLDETTASSKNYKLLEVFHRTSYASNPTNRLVKYTLKNIAEIGDPVLWTWDFEFIVNLSSIWNDVYKIFGDEPPLEAGATSNFEFLSLGNYTDYDIRLDVKVDQYITVLPTTTELEEQEQFNNVMGDITQDGVANILDVVMMSNVILGLDPDYPGTNGTGLPDELFALCDLNQNGSVNIADLVALMNMILGTEE